jgi:hypothetical protein
MIRKTVLALAATSVIIATALPTAASAKKWGPHHGGLWAGVGLAVVGAAIASCYHYQWIETRYGPRRVLVNVCE